MGGRYFSVTIGACCLMIAISLGTTCLSFFVEPITSELNYERGTFTIYYSLITLLSVFSMPVLGNLINKYGVRKIVVIGGIWCTVGLVWLSFCSSLASFYAAGAFLGLMLFGCTTLAAAIIVNTWFIKKRGTIMGIVMAASGVGGAIFGMFLPNFIIDFGWRNGYLLLAGCMFLFTVPVTLFLIRNKPQDVGLMPYGYIENNMTNVASANDLPGVSYSRALKSSQLYILFGGIVLLASVAAVLQHIPAYFLEKGLTAAQAGALMSVLMIAMIFAKILMGMLNDKLGVIITLGLVLFCYIVAFPLLPSSNTYLLFVFSMVLMSFGSGSISVMTPLLTGKIFGQKDFASIWGIVSIAGTLGTAIGTPVWGMVYDMTGSYNFGLFASPVVIIITFLLMVFCVKSGEKLMIVPPGSKLSQGSNNM